MPMVIFSSSYDTKEVKQKDNAPLTDNVQQAKHIDKCDNTEETQTHVHEFLGSTQLASENNETHNHRFAGVTSQVILVPGGHVHTYLTNSDFFDHLHEVSGTTGLQILVGGGKHVHFDCGTTTFNDGHDHNFQFATLIDSPLVTKNTPAKS